MDQYEQECFDKIINGEKLYQDELRDITDIFIVELIPDGIIYLYKEPYFKTRNIVKLKNRFFEIDFLCKYKDFYNRRWEQPVEVENTETEDNIWVPKK